MTLQEQFDMYLLIASDQKHLQQVVKHSIRRVCATQVQLQSIRHLQQEAKKTG